MNGIAELYDGEFKSNWYGTTGRAELRDYVKECGTTSWFKNSDGYWEQADPNNMKPTEVAIRGNASLCRMTSNVVKLECLWKTQTSDGIECYLKTRFNVLCVAPKFLDIWFPYLTKDFPLQTSTIESQLTSKLETSALDNARKYSYEQLKKDVAIGQDAWKREFADKVTELGLSLSDVVVEYNSPSNEMRAEYEKRKQDYDLLLKEEQDEKEFQYKRALIEQEYKNKLQELEHKNFAREAEREAERERINNEADKRRLDTERDAVLSKLEFERKRSELEQEIAKTNRDAENAKKNAFQEIKERCDKEYEFLSKLIQGISLQGALYNMDSSSTISEALTVNEPKKYYSRLFDGKLAEQKEKIGARFTETSAEMTRDPISKKVTTKIRVGDSLAMQIVPPRDGFLSILNLGTSGNYWLVVPNGGVAPSDTFVNKGEKVDIPGRLYNGEIYEGGPSGWEEFVIFITKKPLFNDEDRINLEIQGEILNKVSDARLNQLIDQLEELSDDEWIVDKIGVNVVQR